MSLASTLKKSGVKVKASKRREPVWKGPETDGITFSLLSRFLACRERFRLLVVEGLQPADRFNHRLEFGSMWHVCEEAHAAEGDWQARLKECAQKLCNKHRLEQQQINHWHEVCKMQFPLYVEHWSKHPDVLERTPLLQEQTFNVPCRLPSGRTVRLRGKWDSVDLIGKGKEAGIYLQENKTKSRIDEGKLKRQLTFDLQTMMYLVALDLLGVIPAPGLPQKKTAEPIRGVRYNVVRRTEHRVGKKETEAQFVQRLKGIIEENPGEWFMRWKVEVSPNDVERFKRECLNPILEQLCEWWDGIKAQASRGGDPFVQSNHWRMPYVYNPALEDGVGDLDEYLHSGSELGLQRTENLFPEL